MTFRRVRIPARGGDRGLILKGLLCFFTMFLPKIKEKSSFFELHLRTFSNLHLAFSHL
jgi:hypothetical protein